MRACGCETPLCPLPTRFRDAGSREVNDLHREISRYYGLALCYSSPFSCAIFRSTLARLRASGRAARSSRGLFCRARVDSAVIALPKRAINDELSRKKSRGARGNFYLRGGCARRKKPTRGKKKINRAVSALLFRARLERAISYVSVKHLKTPFSRNVIPVERVFFFICYAGNGYSMNSKRDGSRREFLRDVFFNVATARRRSTRTGLTASPFDFGVRVYFREPNGNTPGARRSPN